LQKVLLHTIFKATVFVHEQYDRYPGEINSMPSRGHGDPFRTGTRDTSSLILKFSDFVGACPARTTQRTGDARASALHVPDDLTLRHHRISG